MDSPSQSPHHWQPRFANLGEIIISSANFTLRNPWLIAGVMLIQSCSNALWHFWIMDTAFSNHKLVLYYAGFDLFILWGCAGVGVYRCVYNCVGKSDGYGLSQFFDRFIDHVRLHFGYMIRLFMLGMVIFWFGVILYMVVGWLAEFITDSPAVPKLILVPLLLIFAWVTMSLLSRVSLSMARLVDKYPGDADTGISWSWDMTKGRIRGYIYALVFLSLILFLSAVFLDYTCAVAFGETSNPMNYSGSHWFLFPTGKIPEVTYPNLTVMLLGKLPMAICTVMSTAMFALLYLHQLEKHPEESAEKPQSVVE